MKTIKYEIKLEKSVKIILGIFAVGVLLNAFETPVGKELFGVKDLNAGSGYGEGPVHRITICGKRSGCGFLGSR